MIDLAAASSCKAFDTASPERCSPVWSFKKRNLLSSDQALGTVIDTTAYQMVMFAKDSLIVFVDI